MKNGFSLIEILVSLLLSTIILAGIFFVFNQAFMSIDSQMASLNLAMDELNTSINGWKSATPTEQGYTLADITASTLPSTFSNLGNYMKIYKVEKQTPFGTLSYKIVVVSK